MAWVVVPAVMALGLTGEGVKPGRKEIDGSVMSEAAPGWKQQMRGRMMRTGILEENEHAKSPQNQ